MASDVVWTVSAAPDRGCGDLSHVLEMDVPWHLFPQVRFIHLIRDERDVALSLHYMSRVSRVLLRSVQDWCGKAALGRKLGGDDAGALPGASLRVAGAMNGRSPARGLPVSGRGHRPGHAGLPTPRRCGDDGGVPALASLIGLRTRRGERVRLAPQDAPVRSARVRRRGRQPAAGAGLRTKLAPRTLGRRVRFAR